VRPETDTVRAFLEPRHLELADRVGAFCEEQIAPLPHCEDDDAAREQARLVLGRIGEAGLVAHALPAEHGGTPDGPDLRACVMVREALAAASPLADAVYALQCLGSMPIVLYGDAALQQRWLPGVRDGSLMAAFAMTEPEAGSDVSGIRTTAVKDGDGYRIDGGKIFISNAGIADYYVVFASTDPERGNKGLSCFVVPADSPGLRYVRPNLLSAPHPLGELAFEACHVPAAARLGQEGEGFKVGMATLDLLRATVAAAACGMAARALDEAIRHALTRRQFGGPLADQQLIKDKLARMATELAAARLLVYRAAWEKDMCAERVTLQSAMAKAFATEAAGRIVDQAVQILGGKGVVMGHPVELLYRAVRALRIYEGTTEIQHLIISGQLLKAARGS